MYNDCSHFLEHSLCSHNFLILSAAHQTGGLLIKSRYASIVYPILTFEYLLFTLYVVSYLMSIMCMIIYPHRQQKIFLKLRPYTIYQMADTHRISAIWCNLCKNVSLNLCIKHDIAEYKKRAGWPGCPENRPSPCAKVQFHIYFENIFWAWASSSSWLIRFVSFPVQSASKLW